MPAALRLPPCGGGPPGVRLRYGRGPDAVARPPPSLPPAAAPAAPLRAAGGFSPDFLVYSSSSPRRARSPPRRHSPCYYPGANSRVDQSCGPRPRQHAGPRVLTGRAAMLTKRELAEYLNEIRREVCSRCVERPPGGPPCAPLGKQCGIEMHLPELIDAVHG